ncbi:alpha-ketoglutarate-dependent dioxygenase AlkB family protein [Halomonas huangheensis]|nr:alpha-ketoglutarate-dependent dioxygenase AlkB [Halomonas huangheensis]ALM54640.1 DNA repair protein [Halomonas huangheensis]
MTPRPSLPGKCVLDSPPLHYLADFLPSAQADQLLNRLGLELDWQTPEVRVHGRLHPIPRQQVWMGDHAYRYSGQRFQPCAWHPLADKLRQRIEQHLVTAQPGHWTFNSLLLNRYQHGEQRMGWHSDNETELGEHPCIASVSLGAARPLRFRWKDRSHASFNVWLEHGSLLLMGPGVQQQLEHALLPRRSDGERINLTYRWVKT